MRQFLFFALAGALTAQTINYAYDSAGRLTAVSYPNGKVEFDTYAGETAVYFDGIPAPLIYVSAGQSTIIVPYAVAGKSSTQMVVQYQGRKSAPIAVPVVAAAPGLFAANAQGFGNGAILNQDNSYNGSGNPDDGANLQP